MPPLAGRLNLFKDSYHVGAEFSLLPAVKNLLRAPEIAVAFVLLDQIREESSQFLGSLENSLGLLLPDRGQEFNAEESDPEEEGEENNQLNDMEGEDQKKGEEETSTPPPHRIRSPVSKPSGNTRGPAPCVSDTKDKIDLSQSLRTVLALFCQWAPRFRLFGEYAARHEEARAKLQELGIQSPTVTAFMNEQTASLGGLTIQSLLILPVQVRLVTAHTRIMPLIL